MITLHDASRVNERLGAIIEDIDTVLTGELLKGFPDDLWIAVRMDLLVSRDRLKMAAYTIGKEATEPDG
jgi:hypothetical protein